MSPETRVGYDFAHAVIDDHSRLAYVELHDDERATTVTALISASSPPRGVVERGGRRCRSHRAGGDGEGEAVDERGVVDAKAGVEDRVLSREELRRALAAIGELHPRRRRRLQMFVAGYSYAEIAQRTGTTPQNVSTLIDKAKRQHRERL